jgi:MOSC domain-containing protein YiiM
MERTVLHADDLLGFVLEGADRSFVADVLATPVVLDADPVVSAHAVMHRLHDVAAARRRTDGFEPIVGRVESLQASGGGVPKASIPIAEIGPAGMIGDVQSNRKHHGRPWQAICLYSSDLIDELRREGHPITPGGTGENITVSGVDWTRMRGGLTITIGDVALRTTATAIPCHQIAGCFMDRHSDRIHHADHPGWARWYASVLSGGTVSRGDTITVTA